MIHERAVIPKSGELAMIPATGLGQGNQFGFARAAAGHGEHQNRLYCQRIRLAVLRAVDVRTQTLVVADGDLHAIIAESTNRVEPVIAAEARGTIPFDEIEQQVILAFLRLGSQILPARPLAARKKSGGS